MSRSGCSSTARHTWLVKVRGRTPTCVMQQLFTPLLFGLCLDCVSFQYSFCFGLLFSVFVITFYKLHYVKLLSFLYLFSCIPSWLTATHVLHLGPHFSPHHYNDVGFYRALRCVFLSFCDTSWAFTSIWILKWLYVCVTCNKTDLFAIWGEKQNTIKHWSEIIK